MKPHAPLVVTKPWGHEIRWAINEKYLGKILYIEKGQRLSLQLHERKDETIYVLKGTAVVQINDKTLILSEGETLRIQPNTVQINDVVRLEDDYGRTE